LSAANRPPRGNLSATGLLDAPLALPHVLLLPSAPVGSLPAVRK
jgi:hypothetical protein